jgi:hypothetical protein
MPITIRMTPIASRFRPEGSSVTPHVRMAPAAIKIRLTGIPIGLLVPVSGTT